MMRYVPAFYCGAGFQAGTSAFVPTFLRSVAHPRACRLVSNGVETPSKILPNLAVAVCWGGPRWTPGPVIFPGGAREAARRMDMCNTCLYAESVSKMIQLRDVPEQVHSTLKARAAREGMSLSDFIKRELERIVERPTMREWLERTQRAKPIPTKRSAAQIVRELRDSR
jgi:hypothetical protein